MATHFLRLLFTRASFYLVISLSTFGWVFHRAISEAHLQSKTCGEILESGDNYFYDFQLNDDGIPTYAAHLNDSSVLVRLLGRDFQYSVGRLDVSSRKKYSRFIQRLPNLRFVKNARRLNKEEMIEKRSMVVIDEKLECTSAVFPFRFHKNLKELNLSYEQHEQNLEWIRKLRKLERLHCIIHHADQLNPLAGYRHLKHLSLNLENDDYDFDEFRIDLSSLSQIPNLETLIIKSNSFPRIEGLTDHPKLKRIELTVHNIYHSIETEIPQLKSLTVDRAERLNLSFLRMFPKLEELIIDFTTPQNSQEISRLTKLKVLKFRANEKLDFTFANLKNLESLSVYAADELDLTDLPNPGKLKHLQFGRINRVHLPKSLNNTELQTISFSRCKKVQNMPSNLPKLKRLFCGFSNLPHLPECQSIETILLINSQIENFHHKLPPNAAKSVVIHGANLKTVEYFQNCFHGDDFAMIDCPVSDLGPLEGTNSFSSMSFGNTNVQDLRPIRNNRNLESLELSGSKFQSYDQLHYFRSLRDLSLDRLKKKFDIRRIHQHPKLESLSLIETPFDNLEAICDHKNLSKINLFVGSRTQFDPLIFKKLNRNFSITIYYPRFRYADDYHWVFQPALVWANRLGIFADRNFETYQPSYITKLESQILQANPNVFVDLQPDN